MLAAVQGDTGDELVNAIDWITRISDFLWGGVWDGASVLPFPPMIALLFGTGLFFMARLGGRPLLRLGAGFAALWRGRAGAGDGAITPWRALSTALAGQVGTGNVVGVATAITLGGPGAIFWMWATALIGMATAYAETTLAVHFRERRPDGRWRGGPMISIKNGLGVRWRWLAVLFSLGALIAALGQTAMIQSNTFVTGLTSAGASLDLSFHPLVPGVVLGALVFAVIFGGLKSIGAVAGRLSPLMAVGYLVACLVIVAQHVENLPGALVLIVSSAFGLEEAFGGAVGFGIIAAMRAGVARGIASNEAGQGTTPIVHAAAQTDNPARQGEIAMTGVFIDTVILCTMTALVILVVPGSYAGPDGGTVPFAWMSPELQGVEIVSAVFADGIAGGRWLLTATVLVFAFTTLVSWSYYAEQAASFLFGDWTARPFRALWIVAILVGAVQPIDFVWKLGDIAMVAMTAPNLVALLALSPVVVELTRNRR